MFIPVFAELSVMFIGKMCGVEYSSPKRSVSISIALMAVYTLGGLRAKKGPALFGMKKVVALRFEVPFDR